MFGYGLLGAGWLIIKTEAACAHGRARAGRALPSRRAGGDPRSSASGRRSPRRAIATRWFSWPNIVLLAPVPIITAFVALMVWRALGGWGNDAAPFFLSVALFLMSYLGVAISLWPMIVPGHYTIWQAASSARHANLPPDRHTGLLPIILMYTAWSYWVFRGKLRDDIGYH